MSEKRAYYVEYPDKEMSVIVRHDGDGIEIWTTDYVDPDSYIAFLMTEGFKTHAFTCDVWEEDGRRREKWRPIDPASLEEVTIMDMDTPYAQRKQLRKGRVVEAHDEWRKNKSPWDDDDDPPRHGPSAIPLPKDWDKAAS